MQQVELNFEGGLLDRFPDFGACLKASVYDCGRPFKAVAADLDMSSSKLSRMLNDDGDISFPADRLAELLDATGDLRPIYWLAEKFCRDTEAQKKQAVNTLIKLIPEIHNALKAAGAS